ncbi:hypothetical protein ACGFJ7_44775 [Actinoplanes sp. NPDC048988]|uniref:hypothetical protein n=1 Tax=Actinoplanes sp. NPDC048988 TaxID=3363901 RepID=UPI00371EF6BE
MREPDSWIWALLAIIVLLVGLAWILKANTSSRPVDFMIRLSADLTTHFKLTADIQYRVPRDGESVDPSVIEGQATPPPLDLPDGQVSQLQPAEGGDGP